jgi:hypothetical protein
LSFKFIRGYLWPKKGKPGHGTRQTLWYANNAESYKATSDLVTRLRLNGELPWDAVADFSRLFNGPRAFRDVRQFIRQEVKNLLAGYWRDLLQSQPNYIEVHVEKDSVYHMARQVTDKYQIPTGSGHGSNSIDPWHKLYERYLASGKDGLFLIVVTDRDPEGLWMRHVAGRTLVELGVPKEKVHIIEAGVTMEQVERYGLKPQTFVKELSSLLDWYLEENGGERRVWETESLDPADMLRDLEGFIVKVLDMDRFNAEVAREQEDAAELEATRRRLLKVARGIVG